MSRRFRFALVAALALVAANLFGAVTTINNGDGTVTLRLSYSLPAASAAEIRADICRGIGWTQQVVCTSEMVAAGQCTSAQLGTSVTNPTSCLQAIDNSVKAHLRALRRAGDISEAVELHVRPVREASDTTEIQ